MFSAPIMRHEGIMRHIMNIITSISSQIMNTESFDNLSIKITFDL